MIALILEFTLFFLVLFFVVPGLLISLKMLRNHTHYHRHADWQKANPSNLAG